jgi:hypothetical protein
MRTYILAIATAALFGIPTAAVSESGHHRNYNRYEGLYDRYESGRCRELRRGFNFPAHRNLRVSEGVENLLR